MESKLLRTQELPLFADVLLTVSGRALPSEAKLMSDVKLFFRVSAWYPFDTFDFCWSRTVKSSQLKVNLNSYRHSVISRITGNHDTTTKAHINKHCWLIGYTAQ